jgi:hypothetical protein
MMTSATPAAKAALLAVMFSTFAGCELFASADRTQIPAPIYPTIGTGGAGTGGSGGGDAGVQCTKASDCAGTDTDCASRTCTSGQCGVTYAVDGTATHTTATGPCQQNVCDGKGMVKSIPDDANLPVDGNPCTNDVCSGGVPSNPAYSAGAPCTDADAGDGGGGKVCDGNGACVGCVQASDCTSGVCTAGTCAP